MSSESTQIKIDNVEQYDATENLLRLLIRLSLKAAKPTLKNLRYDFKVEFYCGDCEQPRDDCYGHNDYSSFYQEDFCFDEIEDDSSDTVESKPSKNG